MFETISNCICFIPFFFMTKYTKKFIIDKTCVNYINCVVNILGIHYQKKQQNKTFMIQIAVRNTCYHSKLQRTFLKTEKQGPYYPTHLSERGKIQNSNKCFIFTLIARFPFYLIHKLLYLKPNQTVTSILPFTGQ